MIAKNECNYRNCKWSLPALQLLRGHWYTNICHLLYGKYQGSVSPLDFFPSAEAMPGEHQVVCRVGAAFVIQALPKSGPTMLLGWFPSPPLHFYCVLNLTPCRPCISVKFPGLLCFVLGRMSGCSFPQELVLVGADSTTLCRSTLAVSNKYRWFFDHTKTKNYEDIKNLNVAVPQHPGF